MCHEHEQHRVHTENVVLEIGGELGHLLLRAAGRRGFREPPDDEDAVALSAHRHGRHQRNPGVDSRAIAALGKSAAVRRAVEKLQRPEITIPRHDSDDGSLGIVEANGTSECRWVACEQLRPERIADDDDARASSGVLVSRECTTRERRDAQHLKKVRRDREARDPSGLARCEREIELGRSRRGQLGELA